MDKIKYFCVWITFQAQKCAINVELIGDDYRELRGEIAGPPDTPYEGATFQLEIKVPETYPFNPPKVTLVNDFYKLGEQVIVFDNFTVTSFFFIHIEYYALSESVISNAYNLSLKSF